MREVFVTSAVRTAIGAFGGALRNCEPGDVAARVTREVVGAPAASPRRAGMA